jgi:2-polyprenyl-6-methoxyphenol hydroxylase-like FAD-dependent oxidoreductase
MTPRTPVLIAGGGIGGLATALTLHQIGVPCMVFESVREMKPLGVGINLQPNAVRELYDLGITEGELDEVGVPAKEWALVGLNGNDIYSETRRRSPSQVPWSSGGPICTRMRNSNSRAGGICQWVLKPSC